MHENEFFDRKPQYFLLWQDGLFLVIRHLPFWIYRYNRYRIPALGVYWKPGTRTPGNAGTIISLLVLPAEDFVIW